MRKNSVLWIALAATLVATAWISMNDEPEPELLVSKARHTPATIARSAQPGLANDIATSYAVTKDGVDLSAWQRPRIAREPQPLFEVSTKTAADTQEKQSATAAEMPALPFTYAGKLLDDGKYTVFLLFGERSLAVRRGDLLEGGWRVKEIRPPKMTFKYLPLKLEVVMDIGESK